MSNGGPTVSGAQTGEMYGRLRWFTPGELDDEQRAYYDDLMSGPRDKSWVSDEEGRLTGAFNARLLDPAVGTAIQQLGAALRFGTPALSDRQREIAILETIRHERCAYEWEPHCQAGLRAGLLAEEIAAIGDGADGSTFDAAETVTRQVAQALLVERDIDDALFGRAEREIGLVAIFDLVSLVAYYQHTALALRVWRVPVEKGDGTDGER